MPATDWVLLEIPAMVTPHSPFTFTFKSAWRQGVKTRGFPTQTYKQENT